MFCLLGYVANASAITFPYNAGDDLEAGVWPEEGPRFPTLRATLLFYFAARAVRLLFLLVYAVMLPRFRRACIVVSTMMFVNSIILFPLIFIDNSELAFWILLAVEMGFDFLARYLFVFMRKIDGESIKTCFGYRKLKQKPDVPPTEDADIPKKSRYSPCINIEHFVERQSACV